MRRTGEMAHASVAITAPILTHRTLVSAAARAARARPTRRTLVQELPQRCLPTLPACDGPCAAGARRVTCPRVHAQDASPGSAAILPQAEFEEIRLLGRGASSAVFLYRHRQSGVDYAMKGTEAERKMVVREVTSLQNTAHPHVVQFHGGYLSDSGMCFLLEYMNCGCLLDLYQCLGGIRDDRVLASVAKQVLLALNHLHKDRKIMHRDLKPTNLLLNTQGVIKIADFGVSAPLARTTDAKRTWVGTVTYMSPERINGEAYTASADMWSLGLCLVECALGRFPYPLRSGNFWEVMDQVVSRPPPEVPDRDFSPAFVDFVGRCLQKDPARRPSSAAMLSHPLITQYEGEPAWETAIMQSFLRHPRVEAPLRSAIAAREHFEANQPTSSPDTPSAYREAKLAEEEEEEGDEVGGPFAGK